MKSKRANYPWLDSEVDELIDAVAEFIMKTAREHQRSEGAIATRVSMILDSAVVAKTIKRIKLETFYS